MKPSYLLTFLASAALLSAAAASRDWDPNVTFTAAWHENATLADAPDDEVNGLRTNLDIRSTGEFAFGQGDAFLLTGKFSADYWPRYEGLARYAAGARGEWRHRFGTTPFAAEFSLLSGADAVATDETGRRGVSTLFGATVRKRFNEKWRGALRLEAQEHFARYAVFDQKANEVTLELGRDFSDAQRLTLAVFHRDGDVLTYASGMRPDLAAEAQATLAGDTFGRPLTAYSIDARTRGAKLSFLQAVGESSAVIVGVEYRKSSGDVFRASDRSVSLALVHQF